MSNHTPSATQSATEDDDLPLSELAAMLMARWKLISIGTLIAGALGFGVASWLPPVYTAQTVFIAPQSAKSSASAALSALSSLGALSGGPVASTPSDQYIALMQSRSAFDRIIDSFKLFAVYDVTLRSEAQSKLKSKTSFTVGKRDGLITVAVEDQEPQRAADMANRFVDILREMTSSLALTEAQQRRQFFEQHLEATKNKLFAAQEKLQASGFNQGALQAEPKAAAEAYARLRAEITSHEVRLQAMRTQFADNAPELQQSTATLAGLRRQLALLESAPRATGVGADYLGRFRDFKYQETLYEMYARQFEAARMDESREGTLIQVVDLAKPADRKSGPRRGFITLLAAAGALITLLAVVLLQATATKNRVDGALAGR